MSQKHVLTHLITAADVVAVGESGDRDDVAAEVKRTLGRVKRGHRIAVVSAPSGFIAELPAGTERRARLFMSTLDDPVVESAHRHIERLMPEHLRLPTQSVLAQLHRNVELRVAFLERFETWTSAQVAEFRGSRARNASALAGRWRSQGLVFAVEHDGELRYPAFQFDVEDRRPKPVIARLLEIFRDHDASDWEIALWLTARQPRLGEVPVAMLDAHPDQVVAAAQATYEAVP